jgi:hypothetical protein
MIEPPAPQGSQRRYSRIVLVGEPTWQNLSPISQRAGFRRVWRPALSPHARRAERHYSPRGLFAVAVLRPRLGELSPLLEQVAAPIRAGKAWRRSTAAVALPTLP